MKKIKVILSALLMAAAISFTACSNASSGSSDPSTPAPATTPSTPSSGGSGGGSGSGSGSQTPAVTYIGSKAPTEAKAVGDIVFTDGSATPYTSVNSLTNTQKQAAVAVIFYVGTGLNNGSDTTTNRTLGVGLKHSASNLAWCTDDATGFAAQFEDITCASTTGSNGTLNITGYKNGSENFKKIGDFSTVTDENESTKYPAFYFGKNYKDVTGSNVNNTAYVDAWYLPSIAELYQIYVKGKATGKAFDLNSTLQTLGGDRFENETYWSSSQPDCCAQGGYKLDFSNGSLADDQKTSELSVCAIRDFTPYTVTLNTRGEGSVSSNKTIATPGETVTLTVTDTTEDNDYNITTFTMNGTTLPALSSNKTVTFTMPAANVTIATTFVGRYVGSKRPSRAKEVGDIVFNDGSSMPYSTFTGLTSTEKDSKKTRAIALIFYKGNGLNNGNDTTTVRTLGVGLKHKNNTKWCKGDLYSSSAPVADAANINITTIQCVKSGNSGSWTFTGIKNGSNNFNLLAAFSGVGDTATADNYPAFYFAKNYKDITGTNVSGTTYENDWYLPSIAELYEIWKCKHDTTNGFDVYAASVALDGGDFSGHTYFSSSQFPNNNKYVYFCTFDTGACIDNFKYGTEYACCIREF